ncbi:MULTISPECIES: WD40 repeat domain-containing serine/threonine protein kinase [unclassified Nocardiopsis]|uniref:WD40 repeat domain-containing serine/threonine protein kinase n=1 Tax=Nocardiopsis TaxID=2013 RepID=UPI00387B6433
MDTLHPTDPPEIGGYRLTARLGAGGMGQVYLARTASGRKLVVKVIRPEFAEEDGFRARFAREAEAARRVGGFHTAQVVDADPGAVSPWIATAYIPGPTLEKKVREGGPIAPPALHVLAVGLAEGLKAIHACDLVHRDLKPANIILAEDGPRIIDFGIARPLDADSMTTRGAVFGTLPYMSPEQTDGGRVGPASDVFSLGTVLAYATTGASPFSGATMAETLRRLISPPPDPGGIDPEIRVLIADCWNHDPDRRPAPDRILTRFAHRDLEDSWPPPGGTGTPDLPTAPLPRTRVDRSPSVPGTPPPQAGPAPGSRPIAPEAPPRHVRDSTGSPGPGATPARSSPAASESGPRARNPHQEVSRRIGIAAIALIIVLSLTLALWTSRRPTGGSDVWDGTTVSTHGDVWSIAFNPHAPLLATGDGEGTVLLWSTETGEQSAELTGHRGGVRAAVFGHDAVTLATGGEDHVVRLWNAASGEQVGELPGHEGGVRSLAFHPDGVLLATGATDGTVRLWNAGSRKELMAFTAHEGQVRSISFHPQSPLLATGGTDGTARIWDTGTGEEVAELAEHDGGVMAVAFHPVDATLATGDGGGGVRLWDTGAGGEGAVELVSGAMNGVRSIAFNAAGTALATGGNDGAVWLWDTLPEGRHRELTAHDASVVTVAFTPDGDLLSTGGSDGVARFQGVE